jgi:hypothetical protein
MSALATIAAGMGQVLAFLACAGGLAAILIAAAGSRHAREDRERDEQDPQPSAPWDPAGRQR